MCPPADLPLSVMILSLRSKHVLAFYRVDTYSASILVVMLAGYSLTSSDADGRRDTRPGPIRLALESPEVDGRHCKARVI